MEKKKFKSFIHIKPRLTYFKLLFHLLRKIPLSPSSPTMYLNLFLVWGKKTPPPLLYLGIYTAHQLTVQSVT